MPRRAVRVSASVKPKTLEQYHHTDKQRPNNPPVGLVSPQTDPVEPPRRFAFDPHLDPALHWAGKAERTSFEVATVSLHVHERIDPRTILEAVRAPHTPAPAQLPLFASPQENLPLREALHFYKHARGWSNRLIAGDSLLVMNSLLSKEGLAGQVQMVYFDPPYGIRYGSNFQPFVNKRDVRDGQDSDLTAEPETLKAFRDTWELGIHSYLSYLRDRLLLARDLLHDSGSVFVQISEDNVHHVREILDEVFGAAHFVALITYKTTSGASQDKAPKRTSDYLVWYAKNRADMKFNRLYRPQTVDTAIFGELEEKDGTRRPLTEAERKNPERVPPGARFMTTLPVHSAGEGDKSPREFQGKMWKIPTGHWRYSPEGFARLAQANRLVQKTTVIRAVSYFDDFPYEEYTNVWDDTAPEINKIYAVQTSTRPIQRCLLMTTDPGDLVLDITCGSGTTAYVAEQWGRRWITCDTSRIALTLAKQRLMTAVYDYYQLADPARGVSAGFRYKTAPHITLRALANNEPPASETLYDQPLVDASRARVTGPFTVEAVPAPLVKSPAELTDPPRLMSPADQAIARQGETLRQSEWRAELLKAGIRGKGGQMIRFSRVEPLAGARWLHAEGDTLPNPSAGGRALKEGAASVTHRAVISFGPEFAPLEQRQVEAALQEARSLAPPPQLIVFAAFQFDAEAAKDIDEVNWPGITLLKVQMNTDLATEDLKKKRSSNESFWLIGQPDVVLRPAPGPAHGLWEVEVYGFDYYNPITGALESGGPSRIAMWLLDTDYDGRSLFPRQVFLPMAGDKDGWARLARQLRAELDEDRLEAYRGCVSLPFALGQHKRVAVKIVDDRGIESLKIIYVD